MNDEHSNNGKNENDQEPEAAVWPPRSGDDPPDLTQVGGMYSTWYLDYASYVILERAVPHIDDGLKPVQRRILHAMKVLDDGRYNKVANIIGHTMQYHPHGDASIGDAIVSLGQRELLIDTQGNWGNPVTGDGAAAARYIEARLSKFALEVAFNPKTTIWAASYDGRNKEPVTLPMKFPLLLAQGVEGIAVGLACKILPHNFNELLDACIDHLRNKPVDLKPDFPYGGLADCSDYNGGKRGGKVRVRARIEEASNKLLIIRDVPYGTTTTSLIDSITTANEKGKIKIQRIIDNTAEHVEIQVHLPSGTQPETALQALYAFTDCEVSISPNTCVIEDDKPKFLSVNEILAHNAEKTRDLLKWELEIRLGELNEKWHFSSLEKIFIEKRIYRKIEECETWEAVISTIDRGLQPYKKLFFREITEDDIVRLTEIKIKRISKYNSFKADEVIKAIEEEIEEVKRHLNQLTKYTIRWFRELKKKYGKGRERRTQLTEFDRIDVTKVVQANETLYVNREEGFAGYGLKKDEEVEKCSTLDDIIVFHRDGTMVVQKVTEKSYIGKNPLHIAVFKKESKRVYSMIYRDGESGVVYGKKFRVGGVTRDKTYELTKGTQGTKVLFFNYHDEENENDRLLIKLKPAPRQRIDEVDWDFGEIAIKGRGSQGNIVTKATIKSIKRAPAPRQP